MTTKLKPPRIILSVDDDADDQMLVLEIIKAIDPLARVATALNGFEALKFLNSTNAEALPCLIILDINMPLMDGKQTLVRIKSNAHFAHIPIVMFTTSSSQVDQTFCNQYDVPFVTKPLYYNELYEKVSAMLTLCSV